MEEGKGKSLVTDAGEEGNVDRITRVLNRVFNEVEQCLYSMTKVQITDNLTATDEFTVPTSYVLTLTVPYEFSTTSVNAIKDAVHEYMVDKVIADWMSIVKKDEAALWEEKGQSELDKIKHYMAQRTWPIKRKMSVF